MNWKFRWITDLEYIKSPVFTRWWREKLETASNKHVFFHDLLTLAWMEDKKVRPFFCIAEFENITVFYPLVILKKGLLRRLVPAGYDDFDYLEPLFCCPLNSETVESFWNNLISEFKRNEKNWDVIELRGIRKSFISSHIKWQKEDICPAVNLSGFSSAIEFIQTRRTAFSNDIERQIKRLNKLGNIELRQYKSGDANLESSIKKFLQYREKKWEQTKYKQQFLNSLILKSTKERIGHFSEVRVNDIPISWHFGFVYESVFYCYIFIVNSDFPNYSVGKIHLYYLVDYAIKNQLVYFDLMRGAEAYKEDWANCQSELYSYYAVSSTLGTKARFLVFNLLRKICLVK